MTDKERLKEISNLLERYYSTEDSFEQTDLAIEIIQGHVDWLLNRIEELEKIIGDLDENVAAFETLWLEEKRKNQRYKQALEEISNADWNSEGLDAERELDKVTDLAIKALEGKNK